MASRRYTGGSSFRLALLAAVLGCLFNRWLSTAAFSMPGQRWLASFWTGGSRLRGRRSSTTVRKAAAGAGAYNSRALDLVMQRPPGGKLGVSVTSGTRTVSSTNHEEADDAGWRVGDVIVKVGEQDVGDNDALKEAVKALIAAHKETGKPLHFTVKRRVPPPDHTQSMMQLTAGKDDKSLTIKMTRLLGWVVKDYPVVLFMDGNIRAPGNNLSARAVEALQEAGIAFRAIDCNDIRHNEGAKEAVEEMAGEWALPQLYAGGERIGNGYDVERLGKSGELRQLLVNAGGVEAEKQTA
eukprot:TRINITY_DN105996_c0_g1_i1.p1 TRINITY_DN105996_c0_g1~~TRINITY_DN105996_c0_g1_i1.p1  ORF type:complete len:313 (+),score=75.47 TRINITY_DN105996_c0_g1_i1:53-940(+)